MTKMYTFTVKRDGKMLVKMTNVQDLLTGLSMTKEIVEGLYPGAAIDVYVDYSDKKLYSIPGYSKDEFVNGSNFMRAFHRAVMKHKLKVVR